MPNSTIADRGENVFLSSLPSLVREKILSRAIRRSLRVRDVVFERGAIVRDVYFPIEGAISNVYQMNDGSEVETGIIGREGMAGFPAVIIGGTSIGELYAQIAGAAWKVPGSVIAEIVRDDPTTVQPFMRYIDAQLAQSSQCVACNGLHSIERRFSRWLLMAHDRVAGDEIALTQEFLALMLGVRRPGISVAAATLKSKGVIDYARGNIFVLDRAELQRSACECYDHVEDRFDRSMGYSIRKFKLDAVES